MMAFKTCQVIGYRPPEPGPAYDWSQWKQPEEITPDYDFLTKISEEEEIENDEY